MSTPLTPTEASIFQKYAPTIFSALVLVLGGLQALTASHFGIVPDLVFAALVLTTLTTFRFTGWWKVGLEVAGVLVAVALPFAITGSLTPANGFLIAVAVVKALATQFGVLIRSDGEVIDARNAQGVPSVTNITNYAPPVTSEAPAPAPLLPAETPQATPVDVQHESIPIERPSNSARIAEWVSYAEQFGYDKSQKFTKAALIAQFGDLRVS
jgi:hypothetical protein